MDRLIGVAIALLGAAAVVNPDLLRQSDKFPSSSLGGYRLVGAVVCIMGIVLAIFGFQT